MELVVRRSQRRVAPVTARNWLFIYLLGETYLLTVAHFLVYSLRIPHYGKSLEQTGIHEAATVAASLRHRFGHRLVQIPQRRGQENGIEEFHGGCLGSILT